jgi:protein DGCR14
LQTAASPQVGGYGFVSTPIHTPGPGDTPLMTWGEIEGTPFRIETDIDMTPGMVLKQPHLKYGIETATSQNCNQVAEECAPSLAEEIVFFFSKNICAMAGCR